MVLPSSFFKTDLLAASVTVAWLWNLVGTAFFMIVTVCFLGRTRHLSDYPWVMRVVTVLLIVATALLLYGAPLTRHSVIIYVLSFIAGGLEGLMWILWGRIAHALSGELFGGAYWAPRSARPCWWL